jgi:Flp pilus assembly protein TadD
MFISLKRVGKADLNEALGLTEYFCFSFQWIYGASHIGGRSMISDSGRNCKRSRVQFVRAAASVTVLACMLAVSGCADRKLTTGSISPTLSKPVDQMTVVELNQAADSYGKAYAANPSDLDTAMNYAAVLRMIGRNDQALAVMRKLAIENPKNNTVLAAYGKALASIGELTPALDAIQRAQRPEYPDWKLMSAEGAILDQMGRQPEARALYQKALDLQPGEPTILSNMGMSYVLSGDLKKAESYLRTAANSPEADSRVRQNLALVVGLEGRFSEAEKIARQELSPDQAEANVAYLRTMLSQQDAWNKLKQDDDKKETATN